VKSTIQRAVVLWSVALALLHITDSLAQPVAPATNQVALRVLIITGGHDPEAAFYGLFEGYQDIGWPAVTDATLAFKQDIRAKYDVLVFYNFTRDLASFSSVTTTPRSAIHRIARSRTTRFSGPAGNSSNLN